MAAEWYFRVGGSEFGPLGAADLVQQATRGQIRPDTAVRKNDGPWFPASRVAGLFDRAVLEQTTLSRPCSRSLLRRKPAGFRPRSGKTPSSPSMSGQYEVLDQAEVDGFRVEVLAYPSLSGAKDLQTAASLHLAHKAGIRLKQVRITLRDGEAIVESGALHFHHGRIEMESRIGGVAGLGKAMMNKFVTKEAAVLPRYRGVGQVYLEPSFSHFLIHRLHDEELIADKGMFYCGEGTLDVGSALQMNVSSAIFGGEGLFQTRIRGTGICVLESPVPADEVIKIDLKNETLQMDGNFALMRTGQIDFSVEKSTRSMLGTLTSGEGLLQTFRGTGSVWLSPTQAVYQRLQTGGMSTLGAAPRGSNTAT